MTCTTYDPSTSTLKSLFLQNNIPHNGNACKKESSPQVKYEHQLHSPATNTRHLHYISTHTNYIPFVIIHIFN